MGRVARGQRQEHWETIEGNAEQVVDLAARMANGEIQRVEAWLIQLGRMTSARLSSADANEFVDRYARVLASPVRMMILHQSLAGARLRRSEYLPGYGELVAVLREFRPPQATTTYVALNDNVSSLSPEDGRWLVYWERREAERFAPLRNPDGSLTRPDITDWVDHTVSLLRQYAPNVWAYVMQHQRAAEPDHEPHHRRRARPAAVRRRGVLRLPTAAITAAVASASSASSSSSSSSSPSGAAADTGRDPMLDTAANPALDTPQQVAGKAAPRLAVAVPQDHAGTSSQPTPKPNDAPPTTSPSRATRPTSRSSPSDAATPPSAASCTASKSRCSPAMCSSASMPLRDPWRPITNTPGVYALLRSSSTGLPHPCP